VLVEKVSQFILSAAHPVRIPAGKELGCSAAPSSKGMLPYTAPNRITFFRIGRGRGALVGREEMGVISRGVSFTHAWMVR